MSAQKSRRPRAPAAPLTVGVTIDIQAWLSSPPVDADGQLWRELVSQLLAAGWEVRYLECSLPERRLADVPSLALWRAGHVWLITVYRCARGVVRCGLERCARNFHPSFVEGKTVQHMVEQTRRTLKLEGTP